MAHSPRTRARLKMLDPSILKPMDTRTLRPPPKEADPHYATPEHRQWRSAVIQRAGGRCQGTDCGRSGVRLFADHIVELQDGGAPLALANGQALCGSCHTAKTNRVKAARLCSSA